MILRTNIINQPYGIGAIGFTFKNTAGKTIYLWNLYPDMNSLLHYPVAPLNYSNADQNDFHVTIQSTSINNPFLYQFAHDTSDTLHAVGQIDAQYHFNANGVAEIGAAENKNEWVHYDLQMTLQDKRGLVPEGDNGFVGQAQTQLENAQNSWEFAAPKLRVLQWKITIQPINPTSNSLLKNNKTFQNTRAKNHVWLDRQILDKKSSITSIAKTVFNHTLPADINKPLYHGTWMSFCFNKKKFHSVCGDAVAIWKKGTPVSAMDSDKTATGGFMNLFTPDSNNAGFPQQIGNTLTETLSMNENNKSLPYEIKNNPESIFQSPLSGRSYAQSVTIKIKKNTLIAAYLNTLDPDHSQNTFTLKFVALSRQTENIMLSNHNGFYEGAARFYLCDEAELHPVGAGFMEQMGY